MKIDIIYHSLTGCTKKVAQAMYDGLDSLKQWPDMPVVEKHLLDFKQKPECAAADYVALGYYVTQGSMDEQIKAWLPHLAGKRVFVFCTLAYFADSEHAFTAIRNGVNLVKAAGAEVIGSYVCNGALDPQMIEKFKQAAKTMGDGAVAREHAYTPEKGLRYELFKNHPTAAECALASERFNERLVLSERVAHLAAPGSHLQ